VRGLVSLAMLQLKRKAEGGLGLDAALYLPSALRLEWIAHIRRSFDTVCEASARIWKTLMEYSGWLAMAG